MPATATTLRLTRLTLDSMQATVIRSTTVSKHNAFKKHTRSVSRAGKAGGWVGGWIVARDNYIAKMCSVLALLN